MTQVVAAPLLFPFGDTLAPRSCRSTGARYHTLGDLLRAYDAAGRAPVDVDAVTVASSIASSPAILDLRGHHAYSTGDVP